MSKTMYHTKEMKKKTKEVNGKEQQIKCGYQFGRSFEQGS